MRKKINVERNSEGEKKRMREREREREIDCEIKGDIFQVNT